MSPLVSRSDTLVISGQRLITFTHGLGSTPDECLAQIQSYTSSVIPRLILRTVTPTVAIWEWTNIEPSSSVTFKCLARLLHSIENGPVTTGTVTSSGGNTSVHNVVDIRDYGAVGDGIADDTMAFNSAVSALADTNDTWHGLGAGSARAAYVHAIKIPPGFRCRITSPINVPASKSVIFMTEWNCGAILEYAGAGNYMFTIAGAYHVVAFKNLVLFKGGIDFANTVGKFIDFEGCLFEQTPGPAIRMGSQVINWRVNRCMFDRCAGSVHQTGNYSNPGVVEGNTVSWRSTDVDFIVNSGLVTLRDIDFEIREAANQAKPFIQIYSIDPVSGEGHIKIENCRFGGETPVPQDAIVIGPLTSEYPTVPANDITISGCTFEGNGIATNAIRLTRPLRRCAIRDNVFFTYSTALINEVYFDNVAISGTQEHRDNYASGNRFNDSGRIGRALLFTRGGLSFTMDEEDIVDDGTRRSAQNKIIASDQIDSYSGWTKAGLTAAKNAVGPDGSANRAFTLTRTATATNSRIATNYTMASGAKATFLFWAKAGTETRIRVYLRDDANKHLVAGLSYIQLTTEWKRYRVTAHYVPNALVSVHIYVGDPDVAAAGTETVIVCDPTFVTGERVIDYLPNKDSAGSLHATPQNQSLILGDQYIGYGSASPSTGRYEIGDIIFNTAPAAGGFVGWVCTAAGAPGTWKTFGAISA